MLTWGGGKAAPKGGCCQKLCICNHEHKDISFAFPAWLCSYTADQNDSKIIQTLYYRQLTAAFWGKARVDKAPDSASPPEKSRPDITLSLKGSCHEKSLCLLKFQSAVPHAIDMVPEGPLSRADIFLRATVKPSALTIF